MRNRTIQKFAVLLAATAALSPCLSAKATEATAKNPQVASLIKKGIGQAKEKEYHQAVSSFNEALSIDPNSFDGFVNRGWTFRQIGDFAGAINDYTSAIKLQHTKPQVYLNRGWCHKRLNHMEEALKDFNKAIELDPKYLNAYRNRGSLKLKMGDYSGAVADFNQLLSLDPDAKSEVAKFVPPELLEGPNKLDAKATSKIGTQIAAAVSGSSLQISDSDLAKLNNRAARAIKTGEFSTAIGILEDITKKKPDYKYARENLTTAYNNQGLKLAGENPEQSASQFRKALFYSPQQTATRTNLNAMIKSAGKDPNSDLVRIALGDELKARGDYKEAFVEYMEALRVNNNSEARQKVAEVCALIDADNKARENSTAIASAVTDPPLPTTGARKTPVESRKTNSRSAARETASNEAPTSPTSVSIPAIDLSSPTPAADYGTTDGDHQSASSASSTPREPIAEEQATALALNPLPKTPIGQDQETIKLKWQNHVIKGDEYYEQGNYVDAEVEYRDALITSKKLGEACPELINSLERMARIFLVQKRPVEALSLLEQAYSLRKDSDDTPNPVALERIGQKVLSLRRILYPQETPDKPEGKDEEGADEPDDSDSTEKTASADDAPKTDAPAKRKKTGLLKRRKLPVDEAVDSMEVTDRPNSFGERPTWADFQR